MEWLNKNNYTYGHTYIYIERYIHSIIERGDRMWVRARDGWESNNEHERITGIKLDPKKRQEALKMGTNILIFALSQ